MKCQSPEIEFEKREYVTERKSLFWMSDPKKFRRIARGNSLLSSHFIRHSASVMHCLSAASILRSDSARGIGDNSIFNRFSSTNRQKNHL